MEKMRIALASDHGGFPLKEKLVVFLTGEGHEVVDFGCGSTAAVDYPDFAVPVGRAVVGKGCDRGILVCGTGIGMSMAANKMAGVRAALVHDETTARLAGEHNRANILCLGGRVLSEESACRMVAVWLTARFEARHQKRLDKLARLERACPRPPAPPMHPDETSPTER